MLPFYRYIRPVLFKYKRSELVTQPRGGLCLRFEEIENGTTLWFSFSRCHTDDLYNKAVAKQIADARAEVIRNNPSLLEVFAVIPPSKNTNELIESVISFSRSLSMVSFISPVHQYLLHDALFFSDSLKKISTENKRQVALLENWTAALDGISASVYKE